MDEAEALLEELRAGSIKLYALEQHTDPETAATVRRRFIAEQTDTDLETIGAYGFEMAAATTNIENAIGTVQVPVGVAGPIPVAGSEATGTYYLPLATTEGALVASINRGTALLRAAGEATARIHDHGMTRAPAFVVDDVAEAEALRAWVTDPEQFERLKSVAESTTNHGELLDITPYVTGNTVYLRFRYDTKDAMGMNMATIATAAACEVIEEETTAEILSLSGNVETDKKPAAINALDGRGWTVTADVTIPEEAVTGQLHTTAERVAAVNTKKNLLGSATAGASGFNAHAANVIAAAFLATGQDEAQVVEGAHARTTVEDRAGDLYIAVTLPSLEVGTVGGGTGLPTQREALSITGLAGSGDPPGTNAAAFAEVLTAGVLAGEVSLLGALATNELARAHEQLGR